MKQRVLLLFEWLASASVLVSFVSYYLAWNKTWLVKHEPAVATSVSISSNLVYGTTLVLLTTNMLLTTAPWQATTEYALGIGHATFMIWVGLGWWVPGMRRRGAFALLRESLRTERQNIGVLARAFTRPAGSAEILDLLVRVAVVDGGLDPRERRFIETFAQAWDVPLDPEALARAPRLAGASKYTTLRRDVERYLATCPPPAQALQLADVLRRLAEADGDVSPREELIVTELAGLLRRYGGEAHSAGFELHLVPMSPEQARAMQARFSDLAVRETPNGPLLVAGEFYSARYAEIVRREYVALGLYAAVERRDLPLSNIPEAP